MEKSCTIQDEFERFYPSYEKRNSPHAHHRKTAYHIMNCKTGAFGVNISVCAVSYTHLVGRLESIISALVAGGLALIGTVLTVSSGQKKTEHKLETAQAVTDCKIDELTREVRLHNNFAQRVPVMEEQIKVINHRIADLEGEK